MTIFRDDLLIGKRALITGGGSGIGLTIARELITLGANVAISGRSVDKLERAADELRGLRDGARIVHASCDIREPSEIEALSDHIEQHLGGLDILINNAGGQFPSPARNISPKGFFAVVRNNLLGTWNMTHAIAERFLIPQKRGRILNITAEVSRGFPGMAHTGAARAGVENLTKTLAVEWAQFGIRVNAVAPGVIRTSGTNQYPAQMLDDMRLATPLKRLGHPKEVSHLVVYLCTDASDFMTGQVLTIDGGASLWGESWPLTNDLPQHPPYDES